MDYKEQIHNYVKSHRDEIVDTLKELVKIPSVREDAVSDAPFGKACAEVLEYTQRLYADNGFETEFDQDGGYLLSYYGKGKKSLGIFAHADVVPVADDWIYTKPFEPIVKDGCLIGRGVLDDKSAVVISLYCAKMLKELDIPFNSRLVCFTGANEESGMSDIKNYVKIHTPPDFSLVADTAFPLYRGDKGMLQLTATYNTTFDFVKGIKGTNAKGAILGGVTMNLAYDEELYSTLKKGENKNFTVAIIGEEIVVESKGVSAHTAVPEGSLNAGRYLFEKLAECEINNEQTSFISILLADYYGGALGIQNEDDIFGKLTFANDMIHFEDGKISLHFNLRFGAEVDIIT